MITGVNRVFDPCLFHDAFATRALCFFSMATFAAVPIFVIAYVNQVTDPCSFHRATVNEASFCLIFPRTLFCEQRSRSSSGEPIQATAKTSSYPMTVVTLPLCLQVGVAWGGMERPGIGHATRHMGLAATHLFLVCFLVAAMPLLHISTVLWGSGEDDGEMTAVVASSHGQPWRSMAS